MDGRGEWRRIGRRGWAGVSATSVGLELRV